ncbi:MAG: plastocyanin/azurin family copper-binding protein [Chloroflexota bacterium]|nr:plastocyanin/azurin family copper-binding protein [Chloroflexota bacterium]
MDLVAYWARIKTVGLAALVAGALTLTLAACGGETNTGGTGNTGGNPTATTAPAGGETPTTGDTGGKETNRVDVGLDEWLIDPKALQVPAGNTTFVAKNVGEFSHNFVVQKDGKDIGGTPAFTPAESPKEVTLDLQPGTYTTICTVPGHAQQGMVGTLTVGP